MNFPLRRIVDSELPTSVTFHPQATSSTTEVELTLSLTPYELARADCSYVRYNVQIAGQRLRAQGISGICKHTF